MANFILNSEFKYVLSKATEELVNEYAKLCRDIIQTPRFWEGWETSEPFRDIVDTGALDESMQIYKQATLRYTVTWYTDYVVFVYMGYTLADGRRIPPREWAMLAIYENDLLGIFAGILKRLLEEH